MFCGSSLHPQRCLFSTTDISICHHIFTVPHIFVDSEDTLLDICFYVYHANIARLFMYIVYIEVMYMAILFYLFCFMSNCFERLCSYFFHTLMFRNQYTMESKMYQVLKETKLWVSSFNVKWGVFQPYPSESMTML